MCAHCGLIVIKKKYGVEIKFLNSLYFCEGITLGYLYKTFKFPDLFLNVFKSLEFPLIYVFLKQVTYWVRIYQVNY